MGFIRFGRFNSSYYGDQIDALLAAMAQANPLPSGTDWVAFIDDCVAAQTAAEAAQTGADTSAEKSEAWAVGTRGGVDVPFTDDTYNNNSKYYAGQAALSKDTASTKADEAYASATAAAGSAADAARYRMEAQGAASTAGDYERSARAMATAASGNATSASESATSAFESAVAASGSAAGAANSATAATAAASLAESWSAHPPYIGANGDWYVWDTVANEYADSGVDASITVTIADVTSIAATATPYVTNTGTATDPVFHLFIPQAKSIVSIAKTATSGLTDTYTITLNDGTSTTFTVVNGADGYSPVVTVTAITGGHRVTITDAAHPSGQSFDVMDGTGDMLASTYDSQGTVAAAGGIPAYVSAQLNTAIADAIGGSY